MKLFRAHHILPLSGLLPIALTACLTSNVDPATLDKTSPEGGAPAVTVAGDDPSTNEGNKDGITYRSLDGHPGCTSAGIETRSAGCPKEGGAYKQIDLPGYRCAGKGYPVANDDPAKPIVLLIHGNSDAPSGWEKFAGDPSGAPQAMIADKLVEAGYRVIAADFRFDKVDDPLDKDTGNPGQNFDHGWATPIAEHLIETVMTTYPTRKISMVGFSLGSTIIRDALRRLHRAKKKPYERVKDLVLGAGANHGVSTFRALCPANKTMRGIVACQLGDRTAYQPTDFLKALNGPDGAWEAPCADGETAFGQKGVCGGNKVRWTTIVMKDKPDGTFQDEFVSEGSSALKGANNLTVSTGDPDVSKYFCNGLLDDHYGAVRSAAGLKLMLETLTKP